MIESLYLHIPFCNSICSYCSFNKRLYNEKQAHEYVLNIINDLKRIPKKSLKTIYIGGGTPLSLSNVDLDLLLSSLVGLLKDEFEFTIESNPENLLDIEKVYILKKYNINRVSIGVQTFDNSLLQLLNRKHNEEIVNNAINNLIINDIRNINIDLIYGIPSQTLEGFINDINKSMKLPIKHISLYSLTIDEHTVLYNKKIEEADEDLLRDMSDAATKVLEENGFHKYEVSNYAKENFESKHNLTYWYDDEYYGIGIGASGYEGNTRYTNKTTLLDYNKGIRNFEEDNVDSFNHEYEFIMLNLRTKYGINFDRYRKIFNKDFKEFYQEEIKSLYDLIIIDEDKLVVKDNNYMILNTIILKFINKLEVMNNG